METCFSLPRALGIATFLGLIACQPITDVRLFVTATLDDGSETISGETRGAPYGDGVVTLGGGNKPTCVGVYTHDNGKKGRGSFKCSDGRAGDFTFQSRGFSARGKGQIDGAPFSIVVKPTRG